MTPRKIFFYRSEHHTLPEVKKFKHSINNSWLIKNRKNISLHNIMSLARIAFQEINLIFFKAHIQLCKSTI